MNLKKQCEIGLIDPAIIQRSFSYMTKNYEWHDGFITKHGERIILSKITLNGKIELDKDNGR